MQNRDFLTTFTSAHASELDACAVICLDIETTGLTLFAPECRIGKNTKIGGRAFSKYVDEFPETTTDTTLRARVISVALEGDPDRVRAWDLDALDDFERGFLAETCIADKVVAGANLAFDLSWLSHYAPGARPAGLLDTHLLVRTERPAVAQIGLPYRALNASRTAVSDACAKLVSSKKSAASLAGLALYFEIDGAENIDKSYQRPENWCVTPLSPAHYAYATGDVEVPVELCRMLLKMPKNSTASETYARASACPHYKRAEKAVLRLVDMHASGMPFSIEKCDAMYRDAALEIGQHSFELLNAAPGLAEHRETLQTAKQSVPASLKESLAAHAAEHDVDLRDDEGAPVIDKKGAILAGAREKVPGWKSWERLQDAKKRLTMLSEYRDLARNSDRAGSRRKLNSASIHSLIGINCATMRTSSTYPNLQNVPPALRAAYAPPEGYVMIAADYSQIELRIAAALASRAYAEAFQPSTGPRWARDALQHSLRTGRAYPAPSCAPHDVDSGEARMRAYLDSYKHELTRSALAIREKGMPLVEVFKNGLDPHLATGLAMLQRQGGWSLPAGFSTIPEFLASLDGPQTTEMKEEFGGARKAAKAVNFGLLYGMQPWKLWRTGVTDYGLDWTEADAADARAAWLEAYPEVAFWQVWTRVACKAPGQKRFELAQPRKGGGIDVEERTVWIVKTLAGRECAAETMNKALNYADQGTGADIVLDALPEIPDSAAGWLVNLVHDEIVAVAREDYAQEYAQVIEKAMIAAGDRALGRFGIPVEVDYGIGAWDH